MNSIFTRFYIYIVGAIFISCSIALFIIDEYDTDLLIDELLMESDAVFDILREDLEQNTLFSDDQLDAYYEQMATRMHVELVKQLPPEEFQFVNETMDGYQLIVSDTEDGLFEFYYALNNNTILLVAEPDIGPPYNYPLWILSAVFIGIALVVWAITLSFNRKLTHLYKDIQAFGQGNFDQRFSAKDNLEPISGIANSFNNMADNIQRLLKEKEIFTHAIPHELRTPINRARFALDMAIKMADNDKALSDILAKVDSGIEELSELTEMMLELSRYQFQTGRKQTHACNIQQIIDAFQARYPDVDYQKTGTQSDTALLQLTPFELERVMQNLLSNAQKYAHSTTHVQISLTQSELHIRIEDDGPGIDMAYADDLFIPFSKVNIQENKQHESHGLGLAIVATIVSNAGGTIALTKGTLPGACFDIALPLSTNSLQTTDT